MTQIDYGRRGELGLDAVLTVDGEVARLSIPGTNHLTEIWHNFFGWRYKVSEARWGNIYWDREADRLLGRVVLELSAHTHIKKVKVSGHSIGGYCAIRIAQDLGRMGYAVEVSTIGAPLYDRAPRTGTHKAWRGDVVAMCLPWVFRGQKRTWVGRLCWPWVAHVSYGRDEA